MFEWTLMKRLIWIKAAVISGAASLYETVTGAIVSFVALHAKALKKLVVNIEPVQDLHGYTAPWPPGGGKNLLNIDNPLITAATAGYLDSYAPRIENGIIYNGGIAGYASGASLTIPVNEGSTYTVSFTINGEPASWEVRAVTLNDNVWASNTVLSQSAGAVSGDVTVTVTIPSGKTHLFVACFSATQYGSWETNFQIEKGSTASAWTPYANECPISGWTGVKVNATGANVWDEEWELGSYDNNGDPVDNNTIIRTKNFICVKPSKTYYVQSPFNGVLYWYDAAKTFIMLESFNANGQIKTAPANAAYLHFRLASGYGTTYNNDISVNYPSTDTSYHTYQGEQLAVTWSDSAGTVYGGTVTINQNGSVDLKVDWESANMGSLEWSYGASTFISELTGNRSMDDLCSIYKIIPTVQDYTTQVDFSLQHRTTGQLFVKDSRFSDAATFKTAMNGVQLVYELAEPVTYHLDSITQLSTVVGTNNIWANTGDVTVTYYAA